jgi:hypothetical protein
MSRPFEPSPPADVERREHGDRWTLVFVRVLRHAPERVWAALTEPAQLEAGRRSRRTATWAVPATRR